MYGLKPVPFTGLSLPKAALARTEGLDGGREALFD
jgi:hypothetical protein